jgi:enoyl-CoA hydratase/carnithine racemase
MWRPFALTGQRRLNAVNEQMHEDLAHVFRAAQYDSADVFVLTGTGGAFCAGWRY